MKCKKLLQEIALLTLVALFLAACGETTATPASMPETAAFTPTPALADVTLPPTTVTVSSGSAFASTPVPPTSQAGLGDLVVRVRSSSGASFEEAATVLIFSEGQLVELGATKEGYYATTLPDGDYDVAVVYPSTPEVGALEKGVAVAGREPGVALFILPSESDLKVLVRTRNGMVPRESCGIVVASRGKKVGQNTRNDCEPTFHLSTGFTYDITVKYREEELQKTGIMLGEDAPLEARFVLPFNEGGLIVRLHTKSGSAPYRSFGVVVSDKGATAAQDSSVKEKFEATSLRDDRAYDVAVQYEGQEWRQTGVTIGEDGSAEKEFVLPWDEGLLAVLLRAGDKPLPDVATVVVADPTGRQVAQDSASDRLSVVLHADEEYTIRVRYKDQPEQQRTVQVSADKLREETFNFALVQ